MLSTLDAWSLGVGMGVSLAFVALGIAALRTPALPNRLLAVCCGLAALNNGPYWAALLIDDRGIAFVVRLVTWLAAPLFALAYLAFVGAAVDSPFAHPLGTKRARVGLGVIAVLVVIFSIIQAREIVGGIGADAPTGRNGSILVWFLPVVYSFTVVAAFDAWWSAPRGTLARKRALSYFVGFALPDIGLVLAGILYLSPYGTGLQEPMDGLVVPLLYLAGVAVIGRAMLRYQLFDFDLTIKLGIRRGTVAAVFVASFFVAEQIVQNLAQQWLGLIAGGLAAGLLFFAIGPVLRVADRVADALMPRTTGTPEYVAFKKLEVYKAAVETAYESGFGVDERERVTLDRLRAKLGLAEAATREVEREVGARFATPA